MVPLKTSAVRSCDRSAQPGSGRHYEAMPELPEVETIRATLAETIVDRRIVGVELFRPGYVKKGKTPKDLLLGGRVDRLDRRGKQLAIVVDDGRALCVHLGMSGQLLLTTQETVASLTHVHVLWRLKSDCGFGDQRLVMRDPRRFGGVWTYPSITALRRDRWTKLGVDALTITSDELGAALSRTSRAIKAALLDQSVLAGLGNIYCDESLFRAGIKPQSPANRVSVTRTRRLAAAIHTTLDLALKARGSTLRDYRDSNGDTGSYFSHRLVYGRAGEPCPQCERPLKNRVIAGRTSVWCTRCQR